MVRSNTKQTTTKDASVPVVSVRAVLPGGVRQYLLLQILSAHEFPRPIALQLSRCGVDHELVPSQGPGPGRATLGPQLAACGMPTGTPVVSPVRVCRTSQHSQCQRLHVVSSAACAKPYYLCIGPSTRQAAEQAMRLPSSIKHDHRLTGAAIIDEQLKQVC